MLNQYFFSEKNFKLIMSVLYENLKNNENYIVGDDEEKLIVNLMNMIFENNNKKSNETLKNYLLRLNRMVMDDAIKIIIKQINNERKNEKKLNINNNQIVDEYEKIVNERKDISDEKKEIIMKKIQNDTINDNSDIINSFEQMNIKRENDNKKFEKNKNVDGFEFDSNKFSQKQDFKEMNNNAPNPSGQDLLIQQPKDFKKLVDNSFKYNNNYIKEHFILIDSRDRNNNDYSNPNNYQIDLNEDYKEILEVTLVSSNIPKSQYIINSNNNSLQFKDSSLNIYNILIPEGNYTINELIIQIGNSMNSSGTSDTFNITLKSSTNKIVISSVSNFELLFNGGLEKYNNSERTIYIDNSIGKTIGFLPSDLVGNNTYTSQNQYNLHGPTYILLHIDEFYNIDGIKDSVQNSFAKIPLDTDQNHYKFFKKSNDYDVITQFSPPLAKLSQLNIRFLNYDKSLYDFGGLEHSFLLKIKRLNQSQGYFIN